MDDDDPLERLLDELLDAHDRLQTADQPEQASEPPLRRFRRAVVVVSAVVVAVSASATAGILIETRSSAPLTGTLPHQLLGSRYMLGVTPDLSVGHVGWCIALLDIRTRTSVLPNPTTCVSDGDAPLIARGGIQILSPTTGAVNGWLLFAIVHEAVVALKAPDGTRILPISSSLLPSGWRAAVTIAANPSRRAGRSTVATLTPLNGHGRDLRTRLATPIALRTRRVNPTHPPATGCRIEARNVRGVRLLRARTLIGDLPGSLPTSSGFLSCYSLTLDFRGHASTAALLVDSRHPGRRPSALPGSTPVRGHPGVEMETAGGGGASVEPETAVLLARRFENAWLVVQTSVSEDSALALLEALAAHT
jgi:hypothetical protein